MDIPAEIVASAVAIGGALIVHAATIGVKVGNTATKIQTLEKGLKKTTPKAHCDSLQVIWNTRVDGFIERREIRDVQYTEDQERLLTLIASLQESMDKANDCLIQIQLKQDC